MPIQEIVDIVNENAKERMVVCEVGCWAGETTIAYLPAVRAYNGRVILVDWFKGSVDAYGSTPHLFDENKAIAVKEELYHNIRDYLDIVTIIEGKSQEVYIQIPDESIDICFIDASHKYQDVSLDIDNYFRKVKRSGIICGHDYELAQGGTIFTEEELEMEWCGGKQCHPGVIQAVNKFFGKNFEVRAYTGNPHGVWHAIKHK